MRLPHAPEGSTAQIGRDLANPCRNCAISPDQWPPTSAAKTTSRARPPSPANSGYVRSFLGDLSPTLLHWWCAFCCGVTRLGGVGTLTLCRWRTVLLAMMSSHLPQIPTCAQPAPVNCCVVCNVQISDEHIRGHSPSCFSAAHSKKNPLRPRTPAYAHALRWWPWRSKRTYRQVREHRGMGNRMRRHNKTRNDCESILHILFTGNAVHVADARGPHCDLWRTWSAWEKFATLGSSRMCRQRHAWLFATTLFSVETVQSLPHVAGVEIPSNFPTPGCIKTWCYWVVVF